MVFKKTIKKHIVTPCARKIVTSLMINEHETAIPRDV